MHISHEYISKLANCLSACCVSSDTVNTFQKHVSDELDPETVNQ